MLEDDIKKCTRCGLCIQNCPIFAITHDENNTCRGLICKLSGYQKKELSDKEIKSDLKICLNCSKCKKNCPSGVNTTRIFAYKNSQLSPSKISQRLFLFLKLLPLKLLYFLNFFKNKKNNTVKSKIVYFKGCVARAQHKTTFLDELYETPDFLCCGLPYLTSGDIKNYNKAKKKNIELIKSADEVVFDCASCKSAIEDYEELTNEDRKKLKFFSENLKKYRLKSNSKYKNKTITFHKPCHLSYTDFAKIEEFLKSIEELNYVSLENLEQCCGFGGSYFMFHPIISLKIALKKALDIKKTNADLILSTCPSCIIGLRFGQMAFFGFKKTLELRDFIEQELK